MNSPGSAVGSKVGTTASRIPSRTIWPGGPAAARGGRTMQPASATAASTSILFTLTFPRFPRLRRDFDRLWASSATRFARGMVDHGDDDLLLLDRLADRRKIAGPDEQI